MKHDFFLLTTIPSLTLSPLAVALSVLEASPILAPVLAAIHALENSKEKTERIETNEKRAGKKGRIIYPRAVITNLAVECALCVGPHVLAEADALLRMGRCMRRKKIRFAMHEYLTGHK